MILEEDQKVRLVIQKLGLSSMSFFDPKERIIEYRLQGRIGPLISLTVKTFVETVAARSPAPGGGSVAALLGALGAALPVMVGQLTYGKKSVDKYDKQARAVIPPMYKLMQELMPMIDGDTIAFESYMSATRLPRGTDEEKRKYDEEVENAVLKTVNSPLNIGRTANRMWPHLQELAKFGNFNCISDIQVGVRCLEAAIWGAYYNVLTNLGSLKDEEKRKAAEKEIQGIVDAVTEERQKVLDILESRRPELGSP